MHIYYSFHIIRSVKMVQWEFTSSSSTGGSEWSKSSS